MTLLGRTEPTGETYTFDRKPYEVGQSYRFAQLPQGVQEDIMVQADDIELHAGTPVDAATYRLILVPHSEVVRTLKERFGEDDYNKRLRSKAVRTLAKTIEQEGLQQPPVLDEGIHRALALALLGWDMPYFTLDEMLDLPEPVFIPTLDGWRRRPR
jgi:hypothetical protein